MPEDVRDDFGRCAQVDLSRGVRVAKHMAAEIGCVQPCSLGVLVQDVPDRRGRVQRAEWHPHLNEQMPGWGVRRSAVANVACQHTGNSRQQWQREGYAGLGTHDAERGRSPIDVIKPQSDHFASAESVGAHQ